MVVAFLFDLNSQWKKMWSAMNTSIIVAVKYMCESLAEMYLL